MTNTPQPPIPETSLDDALEKLIDALQTELGYTLDQACIKAGEVSAFLDRQHPTPDREGLVERVAAALLALKIPDGFDRNGSHNSGTYQEYEWSLSTYLRPQDEWKATELAKAAIAAMENTITHCGRNAVPECESTHEASGRAGVGGSSEIPDNECPDCGATMIEVCSGLEIDARGDAAGLCRHSDYCEKPIKPVSGNNYGGGSGESTPQEHGKTPCQQVGEIPTSDFGTAYCRQVGESHAPSNEQPELCKHADWKDECKKCSTEQPDEEWSGLTRNPNLGVPLLPNDVLIDWDDLKKLRKAAERAAEREASQPDETALETMLRAMEPTAFATIEKHTQQPGIASAEKIKSAQARIAETKAKLVVGLGALPKRESRSDWLPIETAPVEKPILVRDGDNVAVVVQHGKKRRRWSLLDVGSYADDNDLSWKPAFWMSIPPDIRRRGRDD